MPKMSLPLHPSQLTALRPPSQGGPPAGMPTNSMSPGPLLPSGGPNPFMGNTAPGPYGTPAPFNPLLAQTMMGRMGGQVGRMGMLNSMPRGPMGSFGMTPEKQRPRSGGNPYR